MVRRMAAPDHVVRAITKDGSFRVIAATTTQTVRDVAMAQQLGGEPALRLADANAWLAAAHARHAWRPMVVEQVERWDARGELVTATAMAGATLRWPDGLVQLTIDGGSLRSIGDAAMLATRRSTCDPADVDCWPCANAAFVDQVAVEPADRLVLLKVSYEGNDTCWEPDSVLWVLTW